MPDGAAITLPEVDVGPENPSGSSSSATASGSSGQAPAQQSSPLATTGSTYTPSDADFIAIIKAKGQIYSAWDSVMVRRDFGNGISIFEFTPAEGSYGVRFADMKLQPGDPVEITLGGHKVITGAVTTRSAAYDANSHNLVIAGKSLTMDLKDSSVVVNPGNFDGSTFEQASRASEGYDFQLR